MSTIGEQHTLKSNCWIPQDKTVCKRWIERLVEHVDANPRPLDKTIQAFKKFIEDDMTVSLLCTTMFHSVASQEPQGKILIVQPQVRDYTHMLQLFNHLITQAPQWTDIACTKNLIGAPFNLVVDWSMGRTSGWIFFLRSDVNKHLQAILKQWALYLTTPASTSVLNSRDGWFASEGLTELVAKGNNGTTKYSFPELYQCPDPTNRDGFGFTSWDSFFTREFQPGIRPVYTLDSRYHSNPSESAAAVIVNACESAPWRLATGVKLQDRFWLKGQPYSLLDVLDNNPLARRFSGGTVYQAYLSALSYHRWHAPVSGRVVSTHHVAGSYFSQAPSSLGFSDGPDPLALEKSQSYLASVAARALIFIEADDTRVGLLCFVAIGMAEVSSCEVRVRRGQRVARGQQLGMFHYGGSTYCLIFGPWAHLRFERPPPYGDNFESNILICSLLATCQ